MNWEATGAIVAVVSILLNFGLALTLKRRRDEVEVSGHVTTQERQQMVTVDRMTMTLTNHPTREDLSKSEARLENRMDQKFDSLDLKRSNDIRKLHEHLAATREDLSTVKADSQTLKAMVAQLDVKLTNVIGRNSRVDHP